jgi:hypothetical protein
MHNLNLNGSFLCKYREFLEAGIPNPKPNPIRMNATGKHRKTTKHGNKA